MKTPRTDAERRALKKAKSYPVDPVSSEFARKLERELAAMREAIREAHEALEDWSLLWKELSGLVSSRSFADGYSVKRAADSAISKLQPFLAMNGDQQCAWKEDEDGNWDTSCGQCMAFEWAPPKEQGYKFCHHCGKPIKFIERRESKTEDEEL